MYEFHQISSLKEERENELADYENDYLSRLDNNDQEQSTDLKSENSPNFTKREITEEYRVRSRSNKMLITGIVILAITTPFGMMVFPWNLYGVGYLWVVPQITFGIWIAGIVLVVKGIKKKKEVKI